MTEPKLYRIGEFARLGGASIKTLRFYDELGLLRPASVDARTRPTASTMLHSSRTWGAIHSLQDLGALAATTSGA